MQVAAASARRQSLTQMLESTTAAIREGLAGSRPTVALVFFTNHFEDEGAVIARVLRQRLDPAFLLGSSAEGVIGPEAEIEGEPALAVWAAALPDSARLHPFHFGQAELEATHSSEEWYSLFGNVDPVDRPSFLAMGDPFSIDIASVLDGVNEHYRGQPLLGGMASGSEAAGQAALLAGDEVRRDGLVGLAFTGGARLESLVSQGCRPVGKPLVITRADRHVIQGLGGRPPLVVLMEIFEQATPEEQKLMQRGIFLGRAVKEEKATFRAGDFLIRNLMDKDDSTGAIAVNDFLRPGTTVQFHVRDAATADDDLRQLCSRTPAPAGAILFSCNGRGTNLFSEKDHDVGVLRTAWGAVPTAGFFAAGELGPIGGKNFIHGFTASVALLRGE